jgi:hypothetical protein
MTVAANILTLLIAVIALWRALRLERKLAEYERFIAAEFGRVWGKM